MKPIPKDYVLVLREGDSISYWSYGSPGHPTPNIKEAPRYAKEASAKSAKWRLMKKHPQLPMDQLKVETLEE